MFRLVVLKKEEKNNSWENQLNLPEPASSSATFSFPVILLTLNKQGEIYPQGA